MLKGWTLGRSQRPRPKGRRLERTLTSFSQGRKATGLRFERALKLIPWDAKASSKHYNARIKQIEGLNQCSCDQPLQNVGEAYTTIQ